MNTRISTVTITIPYHGSGNVIRQQPVQMDVYREGDLFKAIPLLDEAERRIANLPPQLEFEYHEKKLNSMRGNRDGNLHVLRSIVEALEKETVL